MSKKSALAIAGAATPNRTARPDLHVIKTIDNSMMIVGPVGEANYFAIEAALSAI